jgi:ATP/maltotriose-dependent transcriptional regulator MalT/DNA-binding MarR family transcriptional regulator
MATPDKLSITIDNKILLHILSIGHLDSSEDIPYTYTQSGIAEALKTPLGSVSRALKKLVESGQLTEKLIHVRGKKRRMSAYFLTLKGEKFIIDFKDKLALRVIQFKSIKGEITEIQITQVLSKFGKKAETIDIINHVSNLGFLDEKTFLDELSGKTKMAQEKSFLVKHLERLPKIRQFFDRTKEMNALIKNMKESKIIVVHGIAGIGKSTLAAKFIERYMDSYNIFWYRFQEWDTIRNILVPISEFLFDMNKPDLKDYLDSISNIDYSEVIKILKNDLNKTNSIFVFDDFQRVNERIIQFYSSLTENLEKIDNVFLLILTRSLIRFYDRRDVTLKKLIFEMQLFGLDREGSRELVKPKALDKSGFNKIYELTRGHPLALELIESIDDLKHPTKDFMKFVHEEIFLKLEDDEKELLKAISVYRGPVKANALFLEDKMEYETLDKLIEKALVTEIESSVYEIHDIIREFFYSRLTPAKKQEYHKKAAKYYQKQRQKLSFLEATYHLIKSDSQKEAAKIIIDKAPVVIESGYHEEVMNVLMSFDHTLDSKFLSKIHRLKGQILDIWGEWDNIFEYYYQCFTLGNYLGKSMSFQLDRKQLHNTVGYMSWKPLEVDAALKNLQNSLKVVSEVEDSTGINEILRSLGWVYWLKGDYKSAISYYDKSLKGLKKLDENVNEIKANIHINLGNISWEEGDWQKSIEHFTESTKIFKELNNNYKIARVYNNIGCVYAESGDLNKAINFFNKGISLSDEVYYIRGKAYTLLHLGEAQLRQKHYSDAQSALEESLEIFTQIEDQLGIVYSKINLGLLHMYNLNWDKAKDFNVSSIELLTELDVAFYLGEVYLSLSHIYSNLKNNELRKEFEKNAEFTFKNIQKRQ